MKCPWCGAEPVCWDSIAQRGEWACGSVKHGREPYQFDSCRVNELENENDELCEQRDEALKMADRAEQQRDEAVIRCRQLLDFLAEWRNALVSVQMTALDYERNSGAADTYAFLARIEAEQK